MSRAALEWAFEAPVEGPAKAVLLVLADHANAEGRCWPGMARIVARSGFQERTVRRALRALEEAGHIEVGGRPGSVPEYRVLSRPVAMAPVGEQRPLPLMRRVPVGAVREAAPAYVTGAAAETPAASVSTGAAAPSGGAVTLAGGAASLAPESRNNPEGTQGNRGRRAGGAAPTSRGTRIPDDWQPTEIDRQFAAKRDVPLREVEAFRSYWQGVSGAKGTSPDWSARWRTWCMRYVEFSQRGGGSRGSRQSAVEWFARGGAAKPEPEPAWPGTIIDGVAEA